MLFIYLFTYSFCYCAKFSVYFLRVVRLTSPNLNYLVIAGAVLLYVSIFFWVTPADNKGIATTLCNVRKGGREGGRERGGKEKVGEGSNWKEEVEEEGGSKSYFLFLFLRFIHFSIFSLGISCVLDYSARSIPLIRF